MPWKSNDPDPLEARRRQLEEMEKNLSEQRRKLSELLESGGEATTRAKPVEPLVWRMEEDGVRDRITESGPARKRNLARQRQRDMVVAISLIVLFLIVLSIVLWIYYVHNTSSGNGT